jgi:hypothetical protein
MARNNSQTSVLPRIPNDPSLPALKWGNQVPDAGAAFNLRAAKQDMSLGASNFRLYNILWQLCVLYYTKAAARE